MSIATLIVERNNLPWMLTDDNDGRKIVKWPMRHFGQVFAHILEQELLECAFSYVAFSVATLYLGRAFMQVPQTTRYHVCCIEYS